MLRGRVKQIVCGVSVFTQLCVPLQGPGGENVGSITQPLPSSYLICRAASDSDGEALLFVCACVCVCLCVCVL